MKQANVVVYRTRFCPYCMWAMKLLHSKQVDVAEIYVDKEPNKRSEMEQLSGGHTVPQIFINDKPVGGYDEINALDHAGQLDRLLFPE